MGKPPEIRKAASACPRESEVVAYWQREVLSRRHFTDLAGFRVEIVYPGRPNDSRGADFRDALVRWGGRTCLGSIEIHGCASAWRAHAHHLDPLYNDVVLHVAWQHTSRAETRLQDGRTVPTLILSSQEHPSLEQAPARPCRGILDRLPLARVCAILGDLGEQRLESKAARFSAEFGSLGAGQSLYLGLLEALGYSHNKQSFRLLGQSLPLRVLESAQSLAEIQARALGYAGFLHMDGPAGARTDTYFARLARLWRQLAPVDLPASPIWELFKIRPANHPLVRIAALAYLLRRFRRQGLLASLLARVNGCSLKNAGPRLISALTVPARGLWLRRGGWGNSRPGSNSLLLGEARAAEIVVNVLLPFAQAWGKLNNQPELARHAREIHARFPRLMTNSLERHLCRQLGLKAGALKGARLQQGALQLYREYCLRGECDACPLKRGTQ